MQIEICWDSAASCWKNTVYLDCLRGKKKSLQTYTVFIDIIYLQGKLAVQTGHKRISDSPIHYAIIQKVWETWFVEKAWKCFDKFWLLYKTKVS